MEDDVVGMVLVKSVALQQLVGSAFFDNSRSSSVLYGGDGELRVIA
jgi:hypothetical protein